MALLVLLIFAVVCGVGDGAVITVRASAGSWSSTFVGGTADLNELLTRQATAVLKHDRAGFLADVDPTDARFLSHEGDEYANLQALAPSQFTMTVTEPGRYQGVRMDSALVERYQGRVREVGVTIRYAIPGIDDKPVAEPWIPVFGFRDGRWWLAGEQTDFSAGNMPTGVGGLPWQSIPITVVRSQHVVAVLSKEDANLGQHVLDLSERAIADVSKVRPSGWAGKVLITAVSDQHVFDAYFGDAPDRIVGVAAIAVPRYDAVREWSNQPTFVGTRIVFNPDMLGRSDESLRHTLTHEFTHASMDPLTTDYTPLWLVEGFAEYVAYLAEAPDDYFVTQSLHALAGLPDALPEDDTFYDSADNYLTGWLACRLIAQKYGQAKLIALYAAFGQQHDVDAAFRSVLGTNVDAFTSSWVSYLKQLNH